MKNNINQESTVTTTYFEGEDNMNKKLDAYYNAQTEEEKKAAGIAYLNSISTWESDTQNVAENQRDADKVVPATTYVGIEKFEVTVSDLVEKYKNYFSIEAEPETSATVSSSHRPTYDGFRETSESQEKFFASVEDEDEFFDENTSFQSSTELEGGEYKEKSLYNRDITARVDFGYVNVRENRETKSLWGDDFNSQIESTIFVSVEFNDGSKYHGEFNKIETLHDTGDNEIFLTESDVTESLKETYVIADGFTRSEYNNEVHRSSSQMTEVMQNNI